VTEVISEILIIDDNIKICESLAENFRERGFRCCTALDPSSALQHFLHRDVDLVLLDVRLGKQDGIELLKQFLDLNRDIPVIMITAYATVEAAVEAIKIGAFDYIQKPINFGKLFQITENAIRISRLRGQRSRLESEWRDFSDRFVTRDPRMVKMLSKAKRLAPSDLPVLIVGESGTGKELLADFIHANSRQSARNIVKVNCSAFVESLLDNELFGHERGAYTGADSRFKGVFEQAHQGTLFLDEIGDMPLSIQSKILRALQEKEIRRVGGNETIRVDVRFIAATNANLEELIEEKRFRKDLYYRLNAGTLSIPPLRERKEDIPLLAASLLEESRLDNPECPRELSAEVLHLFMEHDWPGNVRELKNTLDYAATMCTDDIIKKGDLPAGFLEGKAEVPAGHIRQQFERALILNTLKRANHNKTRAAELLQMSRKTLYNKMMRYGISSSRE
jgi:DNA-binding NtrC family response regulator